jgi:hypothetical protein
MCDEIGEEGSSRKTRSFSNPFHHLLIFFFFFVFSDDIPGKYGAVASFNKDNMTLAFCVATSETFDNDGKEKRRFGKI